MKPRSKASAVRAHPSDFIDGDGFYSSIWNSTGDPYPSLAQAAAAWETTFRVPAWEEWERQTLDRHGGFIRGPILDCPGGAVTHDRIGDAAWHDYWPQRDTDPQSAIDACDADLASIEAFRAARPKEARAIASGLDLYISQILWLRNAALRAGTDYKLGEQLVYGPAPVQNETESDDVLWKDDL